MISNNNQKPWFDDSGKLLSNESLKLVSKLWNAETWEQFLQETIEREQSPQEVVIDGYQMLLEEVSEGIWSKPCSVPLHVKRKIDEAIKRLSSVNRKIIRGIFWGNLNQSQIAKKLKISQPAVFRAKNFSLNQIKELLQVDVITAAYLIGGSQKSTLQNRSRDEEIQEVYGVDLNGSYLK